MQTKKQSFIESFFNVGSGFIIALIVWEFVISPVYDLHKPIWENLQIIIILHLFL